MLRTTGRAQVLSKRRAARSKRGVRALNNGRVVIVIVEFL
jgi:hypothetical protein